VAGSNRRSKKTSLTAAKLPERVRAQGSADRNRRNKRRKDSEEEEKGCAAGGARVYVLGPLGIVGYNIRKGKERIKKRFFFCFALAFCVLILPFKRG